MIWKQPFKKHFVLSMIAYVIIILGSVYFLNLNPDLPLMISAIIAVLPVIPCIFFVMAIIRNLEQLDELQQKIQLLSFACSFLVVGIGSFTYGFLEGVGFPPLTSIWVFPIMIVTWGFSEIFVTRKFR